MANLDDHMTTSEAAAFLGVTKSAIWQMVSRGQIEPVKISPRTSLYRKADIENIKRRMDAGEIRRGRPRGSEKEA
jgi:excisionase family DNA binding protein